jgi:hypothetical protein
VKASPTIIAMLVLIVAVCLLTVGEALHTKAPQPHTPERHNSVAPTPMVHAVKFLISGTAKNFLLTLQTPDGGTQQGNITLAKLRTMGREGKAGVLSYPYKSGAFAYLSLQNQDGEGSLQIELFIDDVKIQESRTTAAYGIASVSARVPD